MLADDVDKRRGNQAARRNKKDESVTDDDDRRELFVYRVVVLCVLAAIGGCGFHLEGAGTLPSAMATTYLQTSQPNTVFFSSLREALRVRGLEVVDTPREAGAQLIITEDSSGQRVLSVSARNIPREYEIFYAVTFSLEAGAERLIAPESFVITRSYTFDETQVLGKSREETILRQSLADDLARQVVRRIEAIEGQSTIPTG